MNQLPFEHRLGDWLEEGPARAPEAILDTVLAAVPSIAQRRRWPVIGPRRVQLTVRLRIALAVAAVVVVAVAGSRLFASPGGQVGGPGPGLTSHFSDRYGYAITYPDDWSVREATRSLLVLEPPWAEGGAVDFYGKQALSTGVPGIIVAAVDLPSETSLEEWAAGTVLQTCGRPSAQESVRIGAEPGLLYTFTSCFGLFHLWAVVEHGGSAFHVVWINWPGTESADRKTFDRTLASFSFTE